jgi:hypothetical protein
VIRVAAFALLLAACGPPSHGPQPLPQPEPQPQPQPQPEPAGDEEVLTANSVCTAMACGDDNPCCNSCGFQYWMLAGGARARSTGEPLPQCEVDGCGRCSFFVMARGNLEGEEFTVSSWREGSAKDLEAALVATGCSDVSQCDKVAVGQKLCGGPASYLVYCKESTDETKMRRVLDAVNAAAARAVDEQRAQGMAGTCEVTPEPTIALENGACVAE